MKKIMIALAAVTVAAVTQAASFNWKTGGTGTNQVFWDNGSTKNLFTTSGEATVYLFDAGVLSQNALLTYLRAATSNKITDKTAVATTTINDSSKLVAITDGSISYGSAGNDYNFYMAVLDTEGNLFLSSSVAAGGQASASTDVSFSGVKAATQTSFTNDSTASFSNAGWYAVPEPTSGLLMLLGMAGLALRRKRA